MAKLPDFEAWAVFAVVADALSFARAAEELGLSKATVSKAVARLETRLGARLFHRTSRRLALTEAGRLAREDAAGLLAAGEAAEARALDANGVPRGRVRLAAPMSFGVAHLAPVLPEFLAAHREVSVDLHLSDALVDLVGGGFDLGLRIAALPDSSLRVRRLCGVRRSLVATPAYLERYGAPQHPEDLKSRACLGYAYLPTPDRWPFTNAAGETVAIIPEGPLRANNADALAPALRAGLGLAVQPDFTIWEDLKSGRLERVMPDWQPPPIALNLVMPPGLPRPARVSALIAFLERAFSTAPWAQEEVSPPIDVR
ncbi:MULTISPECIES: LysR family transcriptional regulator [Methylorubrum]|jgi:DNA-binding transcriptional LysR family regulator|uniref:Transcriptional regulator, LysR family n=2 Tax=Methylorubrum TaxID=2282523 RepID=B1ZLJ3_METPB|nr:MULTISPECIES: LysR family transcriptional regulator [Methylorubrum]ACB80274.1 transcriptional regulator, LysR family [Methylorubrum populi BJ001]MBA8911459.1 DNA-binding transcriptional LysR family regulator [Methylorubrum thiocyanatum]OAH17257.1 LysR family transcriptional regulator [Methylorubrum populi]QDI80811.1 LysR family transcriptional regulator [Methylorubrum populi]GJE82953.1 HTH-type transcriptional regulator DmlR [Methylorubrum thiocyanatum]